MTNNPLHTSPVAGASTSQGDRLPPTGRDRRPYSVKLTLLPREDPHSRRGFGRLWTMGLKGIKKAAKKVFGRSTKPPPVVPIEDYDGDVLADAPILRSSDMPSLSLRVVSITSGVWRGKAASLVLVEMEYALPPPIPRVEISLRVKPTDSNASQSPHIVAATPGDSTIETAPVEKSTGKAGEAGAGGGAAGGHADVKGTAKKDIKRSDYACAKLTAKKVPPSDTEYEGICFGMTATPDSEHGLPTLMRMGFVYRYEGAVELEAKIGLKDNWRRFTRQKAKEKHLTWDEGTNADAQSWPCGECHIDNGRGGNCLEFEHASNEYWFSLVNQANLRRWEPLHFDPETRDAWIRAFDAPQIQPKTVL